MAIFLLISSLCILSEEVDNFLNEYRFNGYSAQWSKALYLSINEPVSFLLFPRVGYEGVICGIGGNSILDLRLELRAGGLNIVDEEPDDIPVLQFTTGAELAVFRVTVTALDMLYGETADSAYVFCALRPITDELEISVPVEPTQQ